MFTRICGACALSCVLSACQSYKPRPLDEAAHQADFTSRSPDDARVLDFLRELDSRGAAQPHFDPADGLSLEDAEVVALVFNPDLRRARAEAGIAAAGAEFAGLREDPEFTLDLLRVAERVPDPWIVGVGLEFTIPLTHRLKIERQQAQAEHRAAAARVSMRACEVLGELRAIWIDWSAQTLRKERIEATISEIDLIIAIVDRAVAAGQVTQLEAHLFHIERATRAAEARALDASAALLLLRINQQLGLRPEAQVNPQPSIAVIPIDISSDDPSSRFLAASPRVAVARAEYDAAEESLHREILRQYPDLLIGPLVEDEEGQSRIGLAGGIPLPIWNRNRRAIAEAERRRSAARAEFESAIEQTTHEFIAARAALQLQAGVREELETTLIPLVDEQLAHANRLADRGEINALLQLESVTRRLDAQLAVIGALAAEAEAAGRVQLLLGSPLISIDRQSAAASSDSNSAANSKTTTGANE